MSTIRPKRDVVLTLQTSDKFKAVDDILNPPGFDVPPHTVTFLNDITIALFVIDGKGSWLGGFSL